MNETGSPERISAARRRSHARRRADSGLVAAYIHQLSERHGNPRAAAAPPARRRGLTPR
jgi:hypothetical protein